MIANVGRDVGRVETLRLQLTLTHEREGHRGKRVQTLGEWDDALPANHPVGENAGSEIGSYALSVNEKR